MTGGNTELKRVIGKNNLKKLHSLFRLRSGDESCISNCKVKEYDIDLFPEE